MKKAGVPINQDRPRYHQIQDTMRRIAAVSDNPQLPYNITLFQTNIVNAAAAPGGAMMVFQGLYDPKVGLVTDEDEMAAVIGHEIAHVNCRHVTRQMSIIMPAATIAEIGAQLLSSRDREGAAWILRGVFVAGSTLLIPAYSRSNEDEADKVGTLYMARAGYDPRAAPRIWKRAMERAKGKHDTTSIFATHPSDKSRYENLLKLMPAAMEEYRKTTGNYPAGYDPDHPAP
jgi:predicted Zn-dependent protease